jgi:hypothetical protein
MEKKGLLENHGTMSIPYLLVWILSPLLTHQSMYQYNGKSGIAGHPCQGTNQRRQSFNSISPDARITFRVPPFPSQDASLSQFFRSFSYPRNAVMGIMRVRDVMCGQHRCLVQNIGIHRKNLYGGKGV